MTRSKMSTIKVRPMDEPPDDLIEHPDPGSVASLHYAEVAAVAEDVGSAVPQVSGKYYKLYGLLLTP